MIFRQIFPTKVRNTRLLGSADFHSSKRILELTCVSALDMFWRVFLYLQIDFVNSFFYSLCFCSKVEMTCIAFSGVHFVHFGCTFGL